MYKTIDLKALQTNLYVRLKQSGWHDILKSFILSNEFTIILQDLLHQSQSGNHFAPQVKNLFRAFEECPYGMLNTIIIGQDPYPKANIADGISFSCSFSEKPQPSLRFMLKAIEDTVYPGENHSQELDLKRWSNQGVLMLNTALTVNIGKAGSHVDLWKPFTRFLLDQLNQQQGLIYVFMGAKAKDWESYISTDDNYKIFTKHPASAAYNRQVWDCNDMFNKVNQTLHKNNGYKIKW
jgi:uracil-DNA glycosylase